MQQPREEYLERFLEATDSTLDELEEYQRSLYADIDNLGDATARQMMQRFHSGDDLPADFPTDGFFEFTITDDKLTVYGDFYPPTAGMKPLFRDDVARILAENEIVHGIDWAAINDALLACNTEQNPYTSVEIARGDPAQPAIPAHIVLEQRFSEKPQIDASEDEQIDFRDLSPYILAQKGEQIAHIIEEQPGINGTDVTGSTIPYTSSTVPLLKPGKNTEVSNGGVFATCEGRFELTEQGFRVNEVLMVRTDVGYRTGNIDFPGDVIITGSVSDNFSIKSGGSVYSEGTLDATQVDCDGDVIEKKGLSVEKPG